MRLIEVSGSLVEMGREQGEATAEAWKPMLELLGGANLPGWFEDALAKHCPRHLARMIGIARGAGAELDVVLAAAITEILLAQIDYYVGGCSAFALRGKAVSGGDPVIGKNFDYLPGLKPANIVRISRPDDALASVDVTAGALSGSHEGVNEKGLVIAYNYGYGIDKPSVPIPITMLVQEALERFETTEDAIRFFVDSPRGGSALMMIADRQGDIISLELSPHQWGARRSEHDLIGHTNHYHTPQMIAIDVPHDAYYSDKMPEVLQGVRIRESTDTRYERLIKLLEERDVFDTDAIKAVLADHGEDKVPSDNTICRHGAYYETTMSMILSSQPSGLSIAWGNPCKEDFEEVSL